MIKKFIAFASSQGLIITDLDLGKTVYCGTINSPHSQNGKFYFNGKDGWVLNKEMHVSCVNFKEIK